MNSRERILSALALDPTDRVPCSPNVTPTLVTNMPPEEWRDLLHSTDVTMTAPALGDMAIFGGAYWQRRAVIDTDGPETTTTIETPEGPLRMRVVSTPEANWTAEHFFKSAKDIERILSIPYEVPRIDTDHYVHWTQTIADEGLVSLGIPSPFRFVLGFYGSQPLYMAMGDAPETVERLIAVMAERTQAYVRACCTAGVQHFWMGGSEHCGPGVVHPRFFRRMITPYDRPIVDIIHAAGGTVNQHIHGRLADILDEIVTIGCDVFSPIETGLRGDVTLAEAKARVGDHICLKGNLDDMAFLALATPQEVRDAAEDAIAQAAPGGGFILSGTDAGIYRRRWYESFLIMAEVARAQEY